MACCGQKRALRGNPSPVALTPISIDSRAVPASPPAASVGDPQTVMRASAPSTVAIHYLEQSPILVRGPATGRPYEFTAARPIQSVDARDAEPLLRTRFFRRSR